MATARTPEPIAFAQAFARLQSVASLEDYSLLAGTPALVVDLATSGQTLARAMVVRARRMLVMLPAPTVAVGSPEPGSSAEALLDDFDLRVATEKDLGSLVDAIIHRPLASMALVQLLRHGRTIEGHEALLAESLVYSMLQSGSEFADWLAARNTPARPRCAAAGPAVLVERSGDRLALVLNRPERHNAYSVEMRDALVEALALAADDESITDISLRGNGPSFSAGGDLAEFGTIVDPAAAHAVRSTRNAARLLYLCGTRVRAELHGACIGAGIELAAFAREVIARRDVYFELPEVAMGLVPGSGGTVSIPRRIGRQRTAWLAITGNRIDADTALEWGLVDRLVD